MDLHCVHLQKNADVEPSGSNARPQQQDSNGTLASMPIPAYLNGDAAAEEVHDNTEILISDALTFSVRQIGYIAPSYTKITCCHFSSDGKFLASAGHELTVTRLNVNSILEPSKMEKEHSDIITDVRFRPDSTQIATSSFDKTILLWEATKSSKSLFKFEGHGAKVMSLDFNEKDTNLLCSCDTNNEIRFWNLSYERPRCVRTFQGGNKQVRFRPQSGNLLAAASGNTLNLIDVETNRILIRYQGHTKDIRSVCWDESGNYIASVSEESARLWSVASGICEQELSSNGNIFESCTFHPGLDRLLVIGCHQLLIWWNTKENNITSIIRAHRAIISSLTHTSHYRTVASGSHDQWVKFWN